MAAVAHLSPVQQRPARLVVVRSAPVARPAPAPVSPTTYRRRRVAAAALMAAVLVTVFVALQALGAFGAGSLTGSERPGGPLRSTSCSRVTRSGTSPGCSVPTATPGRW